MNRWKRRRRRRRRRRREREKIIITPNILERWLTD